MNFTISPSKQIIAPDGKRFIVKGVQMFDYLFVSFEQNRANWLYREIGRDNSKRQASGVSEPTYFARWCYDLTQIAIAKTQGANLIRVGVEPAIMKAAAYLDTTNGQSYPSDLEMLDAIITDATGRGMVVQLQNSNDFVPASVSLTFMSELVARYGSNPYVWINPANELNGMNGSGNVNNVAVWQSTMGAYMSALRSAGFAGPIVVNPPFFGQNLNGAVGALTSDTRFSADPCMIIGVHLYAQLGQSNFRNQRLAEETQWWWQYKSQFCIFIDESGIDNYAGRYDANLDAGISSVNPAEFERMKSFMADFVDWCWQVSNFEKLNGITGHMWFAYIPGMGVHDDNSMRRNDGSLTAWGLIFKNHLQRGDVMSNAAAPAGQWQAYTPNISSSVGSISGFNSSGRFMRIGNTVWFSAYAKITNSGSGSGELRVGLPVNQGNPVGAGAAVNGMQTVNDFVLFCRTVPGTAYIRVKKYDGAYPAVTDAQFLVSGCYEVLPQ